LIVKDEDFSAEYVASTLIPLLSNKKMINEMSAKAKSVGKSDGSAELLRLVNGVVVEGLVSKANLVLKSNLRK